MKTIKLLTPAFKIKTFVIAIFVLALVGILSRRAAQLLAVIEAPGWAVIGLDLIGYAALALLSLLILLGLWRLVVNLARIAADMLALEETEVSPEPAEAQPVKAAMDDLARVLAEIQPNATEADVKLTDAKVKAETLAGLILGLVDKTDNLERQMQALHDALAAIATGERDKVALAAGKVDNPTIRKCLQSPYIVSRPEYRADVITLISSDVGTVEHWRNVYTRYTTALFGQVMDIERRLAALEAGREFLQASQPLLEIRQNLSAASEALQLKRPDVRYTAQMSLPGQLSQHFLEGGK